MSSGATWRQSVEVTPVCVRYHPSAFVAEISFLCGACLRRNIRGTCLSPARWQHRGRRGAVMVVADLDAFRFRCRWLIVSERVVDLQRSQQNVLHLQTTPLDASYTCRYLLQQFWKCSTYHQVLKPDQPLRPSATLCDLDNTESNIVLLALMR